MKYLRLKIYQNGKNGQLSATISKRELKKAKIQIAKDSVIGVPLKSVKWM